MFCFYSKGLHQWRDLIQQWPVFVHSNTLSRLEPTRHRSVLGGCRHQTKRFNPIQVNTITYFSVFAWKKVVFHVGLLKLKLFSCRLLTYCEIIFHAGLWQIWLFQCRVVTNSGIKSQLTTDIRNFDPSVASAGFNVDHAYVVTWSGVPAYPGSGAVCEFLRLARVSTTPIWKKNRKPVFTIFV